MVRNNWSHDSIYSRSYKILLFSRYQDICQYRYLCNQSQLQVILKDQKRTHCFRCIYNRLCMYWDRRCLGHLFYTWHYRSLCHYNLDKRNGHRHRILHDRHHRSSGMNRYIHRHCHPNQFCTWHYHSLCHYSNGNSLHTKWQATGIWY